MGSGTTPTPTPAPGAPARPRERILRAAGELFYAKGINSVGIDAVIASAGVAKASLYKHFGSKDELVVAFLADASGRWLAWLDGAVVRAARTRDRALGLFDALEEWFSSPEFRGCPMINTVAEIADGGHAARGVAAAHGLALERRVAGWAQDAGARDVAAVTSQLMILIDGAIVRAATTGVAETARAAKAAAAALLREA